SGASVSASRAPSSASTLTPLSTVLTCVSIGVSCCKVTPVCAGPGSNVRQGRGNDRGSVRGIFRQGRGGCRWCGWRGAGAPGTSGSGAAFSRLDSRRRRAPAAAGPVGDDGPRPVGDARLLQPLRFG